MQPSQEIRNIALQLMSGQLMDNLDALIATLSQEPGYLTIGTAPTEWFTSVADFEQAMRAGAAAGAGGMPPLENLDVQAYQEGSVGWGYARGTLRLPTGAALAIRQTFVVHQESGRWKTVQTHVSIGVPDDQIVNLR